MLHRIRLGMSLNAKKFGTKAKIGGGSGPVEVDETFVGGRLKNMHKDRREHSSPRRNLELADRSARLL
jgi:hypothetical protein